MNRRKGAAGERELLNGSTATAFPGQEEGTSAVPASPNRRYLALKVVGGTQ
ncbi:MAG TPA: hypothetical protein VFA75_12790 [Nevskia sp.]|nr:hypothetical protein [Nevskia sp.]